MSIMNILRVAASAILLCLCVTYLTSASASAQVIQVSGRVTFKPADGPEVPLQGATVTIHRTDIRGKYEVKTNKDGRYVYAGIPLIGTYTIIVSAPNARPTFLTDIRLSQKPDGNDFTLTPGDGSTLTLEQVKAASGGSAGAGTGGGAANSAASSKAREEMAKKQAEAEAEIKKVTETNAKLNDVMKLGNEAFNAKKYDEAITLYDQGIQADPEQAVFYRNKSLALRSRGVEKFNTAVKARDTAGKDAARADFKAATESSEKGLTLYRDVITKRAAGGQGAAAAGAAGGPGKDELLYLESRAENYRIALQTNTQIPADDAAKAIQEYVTKETDPVKKGKAQASLGEALFQSGKVDEAVAAYQQILSTSPDNLDALYGLGLAMAADPNATPKKMEEARDMLQKFIAKAPDTHPKKQEATEAVSALNDAIKATTSKPETDTKTRPARRRS